MTAALPMGAQKITGMADPTVSTDAATKNYVDTTTATFFSTGDVKITLKTTPDSGWLLFDDGTFGSATSGSSNSNSANNLTLFTLFYNTISDANAPLFTSGGGATTRVAQVSAAAAWAANCRMSLPKTLGRALGIAGAGSGLTARALGQPVGGETTTITQSNLPNVTIPVGLASGSFISSNVATQTFSTGIGNSVPLTSSQSNANTSSLSGGGATVPISIMQPITFFNAMVKV